MAKEFRGEDFECFCEKTETYISFSVPIKNENDNDSGETSLTKQSLLINVDSCKATYQILLITCLKLI